MQGDAHDPKALIHEAYRIDGITEAECRSIFMDWALSLDDVAPDRAIPVLLDRHGDPDHPMTRVLRAALEGPARTGRRGGWRARRGGPR